MDKVVRLDWDLLDVIPSLTISHYAGGSHGSSNAVRREESRKQYFLFAAFAKVKNWTD